MFVGFLPDLPVVDFYPHAAKLMVVFAQRRGWALEKKARVGDVSSNYGTGVEGGQQWETTVSSSIVVILLCYVATAKMRCGGSLVLF
jgi:hypothetical protein